MTPPPLHQAFVDRALPVLAADARIVGVAAGGSWLTGTMDAYSDVDLVAVVAPEAEGEVMVGRRAILERLGPLLVAVTGEHVGERRLMIALYGPPLLHVDVKFVALGDLAERVEDPVVLWERDLAVTRVLEATTARWPAREWQWIEDRFWIWIHYGATKVARGELFEALHFLAFLRGTALAPAAALAAGRHARGVRHLERDLPRFAAALRSTVGAYDVASLRAALAGAVALYRATRAEAAPPGLVLRTAAEEAAVAYLDALDALDAGVAAAPRDPSA